MARGGPRIDAYLPPEEWSGRWWSPADLLSVVREHNGQVPGELLFGSPDLKPLREAYAAALFGTIRAESKAYQLRLVRGPFPDFELRFGGDTQPFELTEADREGRRRDNEYRRAAAKAAAGERVELEEFDADEEERAALPAIERALSLKARKRYRPQPHLLVYVNFFLFRAMPVTESQFAELVQPYEDQFPSIWLLWGSNAVRCYPNAEIIIGRDLPRWIAE